MKFVEKVTEVMLGSRDKTLRLGGQSSLPFLKNSPKPAIAMLISDAGLDLPEAAAEPYKELFTGLLDWAHFCVDVCGVDAIAVRFTNTDTAVDLLKELLDELPVPLIISGPGDKEQDSLIIKNCGEAAEGANLLLCSAKLESYKSIAATAMIYGHSVVAESPIDVNIAKQLNILLTDLGLPLERIVIDPLVASLGYGLEYTFSVMERIRSVGLSGDQMLCSPMICFAFEAWKAREATFEYEDWGPLLERGVLWEALTAATLYSAGGDLFVFKHPQSIQLFKSLIEVK